MKTLSGTENMNATTPKIETESVWATPSSKRKESVHSIPPISLESQQSLYSEEILT